MVALSLFLLGSALPALAFHSHFERDSNKTAVSATEDSGAETSASATQWTEQTSETEAAQTDASPQGSNTQIQLKGNSFCLATMDSTEVWLMACADDATQKWVWESVGNKDGVEHFTIKSEAQGVCLTKEPVDGEFALVRRELTEGRPDYISTRLRAVLEPCGSAYTWGWYGDRLCIRECEFCAALRSLRSSLPAQLPERAWSTDLRVLPWRRRREAQGRVRPPLLRKRAVDRVCVKRCRT